MPGLARVEALMHGVVGAPPSTLPTYVGHGTGVGGVDPLVDLAPSLPASLEVGDWLIVPVGVRATSAPTCAVSDPVNWALWYDDQSSTSSFIRQFIFARQYAEGVTAPTFDWGAGGATPAARARMFAVRGASGAREGAATATANLSAAIAIPSVTTTGANRFVVACEAVTQAISITAAPTGTTGGTYTVRTNTTTGSGGANIILLTADMAAAGTIANGVHTTTGTPNWVCRAFALLPV